MQSIVVSTETLLDKVKSVRVSEGISHKWCICITPSSHCLKDQRGGTTPSYQFLKDQRGDITPSSQCLKRGGRNMGRTRMKKIVFWIWQDHCTQFIVAVVYLRKTFVRSSQPILYHEMKWGPMSSSPKWGVVDIWWHLGEEKSVYLFVCLSISVAGP